ncbi:MAG: CCA tRNA nucleotidyltransferase [Sphaerochaetaceae bacterium]|nr:CCA tRNA nucleotidyltransferase [Sphaerochaetaceae bacterium]
MNRFPVPSRIRQFATRFHDAGFSLYIVGGAVRDQVIGRSTNDYDFATDALPQQVVALFRNVVLTGIKHGTVTVLLRGESYEVTTFRTDGTYDDHRHPEQVHFVSSLADDLSRRDFTINALAAHARTGEIIDLHGGMRDIEDKCIRAIGDPLLRFTEDALRILRGCRFSAQLEFSIEQTTLHAMYSLAHTLVSVSGERVRAELFKILDAGRPSVGLRAMQKCGALEVLLPELAEGASVTQKGNHRFDVLDHAIACCDAAPRGKPLVRLAALLHDIGKPRSKAVSSDGEVTFHQHEIISAQLAKGILDRLKCSNEEKSTVLNLIRNHMFHYTEEWTDGAVRRFINRVGCDAIADLFDLRRADRMAINGDSRFDDLVDFMKRIERVLAESSAMTVRELRINGNDLAALGIPRGPLMGRVLDMLLQTVLDDPSQNEPERLRTIARLFHEQRIDVHGR